MDKNTTKKTMDYLQSPNEDQPPAALQKHKTKHYGRGIPKTAASYSICISSTLSHLKYGTGAVPEPCRGQRRERGTPGAAMRGGKPAGASVDR